MKFLKLVFFNKEGEFSWRKAMTASVTFAFVFSVIAFLFGKPELPTAYTTVIGLVFAFYFTKDTFKSIKLANKE